jgi:hypothetical protein
VSIVKICYFFSTLLQISNIYIEVSKKKEKKNHKSIGWNINILLLIFTQKKERISHIVHLNKHLFCSWRNSEFPVSKITISTSLFAFNVCYYWQCCAYRKFLETPISEMYDLFIYSSNKTLIIIYDVSILDILF